MSPIDLTSELCLRAQELWRTAEVIWLTTVRADGTPQPNPVWFVWDGETFLIYSQPNQQKLRNVARHPIVALNLNGAGWDRDIVIVTGEARIAPEEPLAEQVPAYVEKYRENMARLGMTPAEYSRTYTVPIRVRPVSLWGH